MDEDQNSTPNPAKEAWNVGLDEQLPHAHTETLKAALDHTTKMLDHVYAANDAISQKARWAIGLIVVLIGIVVRLAFMDAKDAIGSHCSCLVWILYAVLVLVLGASLTFFYLITRAETHYHSGIMPQDASLKETLKLTHDFVNEGKDKNGSDGLDFAYFVASSMEEYQRRIDLGRELNKRIARHFNWGLNLLLGSLGWWVLSYCLLNG